ncbi:hypothetical protein [Tabrizicola sp.]|uniref:hypothetical protein n=1 Tax=Tabrizicola sp. TaxID=2005166 RepID=UPI003D2A3AF7
MKRLILIALTLLVACGTPQEQCINANTRDLQVVDRLIRETEGNLARGYGFETVTDYKPMWIDCTPKPTTAVPQPKSRMCFESVPVTVRKEVALDLGAERAKLKSLQSKRADLAKAAESVIAQCRAKYPE